MSEVAKIKGKKIAAIEKEKKDNVKKSKVKREFSRAKKASRESLDQNVYVFSSLAIQTYT